MAELRREAPGAAARAYMEKLEAEMDQGREMDKGWIDEIEEEMKRSVGKEGREGRKEELLNLGLGLGLGEVKLERLDEMERMWEKGTEGLVGLEKVTEVLATLERARKAIEVVQEM